MKNIFTLLLPLSGLALASCNGFQLDSEKAEAQRITDTQESILAAKVPELTATSKSDDYVLYALLTNPKVKESFARWKSASQSIAAARSLPDPMLEFQTDIMDSVVSVMPGFMAGYTLPVKREALGDLAYKEARVSYYEFRKSTLEVLEKLFSTWADYEYFKSATEITSARLSALEQNYEFMKTSYETAPSASIDEQLSAYLNFSDAQTSLENDKDGLKYSKTAFLSALGISYGGEAPMPPQYPDDEESFDTDILWEAALKGNPELMVIKATVDKAAAQERVAQTSNLPDFEIGLEADVKTSPVMYRPKAKMSLPIWRDKIESMVSSAQSSREAALYTLNSAQIELAARIAKAEYELGQNRRTAAYIKNGAIPQIDASIAAANVDYQSAGKNPSRVSELETLKSAYSLQLAEAARNIRKTRAELRFLIVGALPQNAEFLTAEIKKEKN